MTCNIPHASKSTPTDCCISTNHKKKHAYAYCGEENKRKTGTARARFPVCDCFSNVCLTHMDGTENHSQNDLIPLVRLRIRCDHSRNRMSTQDTYLRNANQVCKARKPRSYCSLMFEHFMVDCSVLLKQVPNPFGFETCYGWRPFARLVVAGCHPDTA